MGNSTRASALFLVISAFIACLSGCGGGSSNPPVNQNPANCSATATEHLYVVSNGQLLQYALPLASSSTPCATVMNTANPINAVAVDSNGNLAVADSGNHISIYNAPISNSSTPSATFTNGTATVTPQLAFNAAGDLFAATGVGVNVFRHPLSSSSTVSQAIGLSLVNGLAVDASGNLYTTDADIFGRNEIEVLAPPYTGTPVVSGITGGIGSHFSEIALSSTQLFVASIGGEQPGGVFSFTLPTTAGQSGGLTLAQDSFSVSGVAVDGNGNVYVSVGNGIRVYAPPISNSSTSQLTLFPPGPPNEIATGK